MVYFCDLGQTHIHTRPCRLPKTIRTHSVRLEGGCEPLLVRCAYQDDVWFFDKPSRNDLHPTMKQVALVERAIRNSSRAEDVILDPFGDSGSP